MSVRSGGSAFHFDVHSDQGIVVFINYLTGDLFGRVTFFLLFRNNHDIFVFDFVGKPRSGQDRSQCLIQRFSINIQVNACLLYTSDAADE